MELAPKLIDIVVAANSSYSCLRVPSAVQVPGGDILVFLEARKHSCDDQAPKDIVVTRSTDGSSWTVPTVVVGSGPNSSSNTTYRNPFASVFAAPTGGFTVLLQFVNSTLAEPWTSLQTQSSDDGVTWGSISSQGAPVQSLDGVLPGPGFGLVLGQVTSRSPSPGRIVSCGATGYHKGHTMEAALWYSDDSGASWQLSTPTFPSMQECQPAELADGSLLVTFRAGHLNSTCDCRSHARSVDGGKTWSALEWDAELIEPVCSAGLVGAGPDQGLYFSNPASRSHRVNMTMRWSHDGGVSWPGSLQLWAGPSAYSTLVGLRPAATASRLDPFQSVLPAMTSIGIVFERGITGTYERITFASIPVQQQA
jgi:sialidase-1